MPIQALPEATTRRLGAGQALPTPAALVKELLDNAIDARATSIEVLLSANTLDKIEVRDNGTGIAADDLEQVGKRGHTSKLTCFEELRTVGRVSLGFRGEALASACTMGEVAITTRTEGEPVATSVKLKPNGGIERRSSKSHPIGTTVCVSNLFSRFSVRKQNFLKQTSKIISEIKDLLQSYALARLHIRLSLKVTKSPKANWTYVSRAQDGLKEAAAKVVGKDVAALCREETKNFQDHNFTLTALIPQTDADLTKVKGGCHVSVDGRPLSCSRQSLARKISTGYKEALKELARNTGQELCKDPFFYLRISCVADIYDPNVEPSKDDIIFANVDTIVSSLDEFFRSLYPPPAVARQDQFQQLEAPVERSASVLESDHDALLTLQLSSEAQEKGRDAPSTAQNDQNAKGQQPRHGQRSRARSQTPFTPPPASQQVANNSDDVLNPWSISNRSAAAPQMEMRPPFQLTSDTTPRQQRLRNKPPPNAFQTPPASHGKSLNQIISNAPYNPPPFSVLFSKRPPGQKTIESWLTHSDVDSHLEGPLRSPTPITVFDDDAPFMHNHSRLRRHSSYHDEQVTFDVNTPSSKQQKLGPAFVKAGSLSVGMNATPPFGSQTGDFTAVNAFTRPSPGVSRCHHESSDDLPMMSMDDEPHILGHPSHPSQCQLLINHDDDEFHSSSQRRVGSVGSYHGRAHGSLHNKPFQSLRCKSVSKSNTASHRYLPGPDLPMMSLDDDEPLQAPPLPKDDDLVGHGTSEQALDFEHRKVQATKRLRAENALQELKPNNAVRPVNPERGTRMLGQMAGIVREDQISTPNLGLDVNRPDTEFTKATSRPRSTLPTTLPHDDPRAYLMKRQMRMSRAGHKIKRYKTALLPLETVQPSEEMHGLVLMTGIADINKLAHEREKMERWDEYISYGMYKDGLEMDKDEVEEVEESIRCVMVAFEARNQSHGSQMFL